MRWIVETRNGEFEDVGADLVGITHGGVLLFTDKDTKLEVAYAPGQWRTVVQEGEE